MKVLQRALLAVLSAACLATFATAQTIPVGTFKHIIIVIQENRTPDNIFGYWATSGGPNNCPLSSVQFTGADINNGGYTIYTDGQGQQHRIPTCNLQQPMNNGSVFDPGHFYHDWSGDYHGGLIDGFCHTYDPNTGKTTYVNCPTAPSPSPYSYIQPSDVQPYFDIATTYGFANYMFQTNEGPSFPAHQFLFSGSSAPVAPNDPQNLFWDFVQDNPGSVSYGFNYSGCPYDISSNPPSPAPPWIKPDRTSIKSQSLPTQYQCYTHDSLMTGSNCPGGVCDKYPNLTWTYYSPVDQTSLGSSSATIWNAPEAIPEVCYGENDLLLAGTPCGGTEWNSHMKFTSSTASIPILTDINTCQLPNISWVIPDQQWSDHPQDDGSNPALGPSWVGTIVNAIGNSYANSNHKCDYWGTNSSSSEPTAIFIVWDDWGGFYDHVLPYEVLTGTQNGNSWNCPAPATNSWGCGYTYGLRVPFMVVSEFTGTKSGSQYSGYISGACGTTPPCPNLKYPYIHDFGSILAFTEQNFNLKIIDQSGDQGYADNNALDWDSGHRVAPLSDFFSLYTAGGAGRPFVPISVKQTASFFQNYYATTGATPTGPDTD